MSNPNETISTVDNGAPEGWDDVFTPDEAPADDEQPVEDSEAQTDEEPAEDEVEEAEETTDDTDEAEEEPGKQDDQSPDEDPEIDMGNGRQPVRLSELKKGYLRQSDYTKKTQALAEERKAYEAERQAIEPVKQLSDFLDQNPYVREQIRTFIREFTQTGRIPIEEALQDAVYGQYINALMAQNAQLQRELYDYRAKYGELEFSTKMDKLSADLKRDYGDLVTEEYLGSLNERAKKENLTIDVLKEIAEAHLAKQKLAREQEARTKAAKEAEIKTYQKMREKSEALPPRPKKTGQVPKDKGPDDPFSPMGWDDVFS